MTDIVCNEKMFVSKNRRSSTNNEFYKGMEGGSCMPQRTLGTVDWKFRQNPKSNKNWFCRQRQNGY